MPTPAPRPARPLLRALTCCALLAAVPWTTLSQALAPSPAPHFEISYSAPSELRAPLRVRFQATLPPEYRVAWSFGDGGSAGGPGVEYTYYRAGSYTVQAELQDARGRVVSRARGTIEVRSGGPERGELTVLLGRGEVRLSAVDSVIYAPGTPQLLLNGQEVGAQRMPVGPGLHQAATIARASDGRAREKRLSFSMAPLGGSLPFETEVLRLTNRARAQGWNCATLKTGGPALAPLKQQVNLDTAALAQSAGMALAGYFDHTSGLDGSSPMRRVQATGFSPRGVAENIAAGQVTPAEVVDAWLRSPGHCKNIMGAYSLIGLSYVGRPGTTYGHYWTQVFAQP